MVPETTYSTSRPFSAPTVPKVALYMTAASAQSLDPQWDLVRGCLESMAHCRGVAGSSTCDSHIQREAMWASVVATMRVPTPALDGTQLG